ncbi:M12 family metallopeptidase [Hoeflea prorocentri]|uniref:M12 family metallopeptidase n=1 Tax=Hoeflea prorocentri TaxID=1922333 RepID=A0A9X3UGU4_9HYPH|nr:M12 family metallopeptidase [Hoeflea prorocentri]MCY6381062.1 M12 family metallopeptidase [Hoeflea prorocentri]MDA5398862.1 M12 family metallopeptidase [Hoeflea prorocentri]
MKAAKHMCYDRILPQDLVKVQRTRMIGGRERAISLIGKQWANGSTLRIRFLGGTQQQQDMVRQVAPMWTDHANLNFDFTDDPRAEIRVTFDENDGAWSYVGTDNASIPLHAATLNLGWLDQGVILHEFGHMIGLSHEHQNPDGGIMWNEQQVIDDLSGAPNFWDEATIRHNVLNKYSADQVHGTEFDPQSIMLYAFPDSWTTNMGATSENNDLSDQDKAFIASAVMYPGRGGADPNIVELDVMRGTEAEISSAGEEDLFSFKVKKDGMHIIETTGSTDVVMVLFGPDSKTAKVAENDDGGRGQNSRIVARLREGTYYAAIRHYNPNRTGEYRIMVSAS